MLMEKRFGLIGGGSWATALAKLLSNNSDQVKWWFRDEESVEHLKKFKHNKKYLQSVEFDLDRVHPSSDLEWVIKNSNIIVVAVPSAFVFKTFDGLPVRESKKRCCLAPSRE